MLKICLVLIRHFNLAVKECLRKLNSALLDLPSNDARYEIEAQLDSLKLLSDLILSSDDRDELGMSEILFIVNVILPRTHNVRLQINSLRQYSTRARDYSTF
jgi:hypothetical protein